MRFEKERLRNRGRKVMKKKAKWRVTSGEIERRELMKRRDLPQRHRDTEADRRWVGSGVHGDTWGWGRKKDETGTRSAEPWVSYYRIRYYLSSEKLKPVN